MKTIGIFQLEQKTYDLIEFDEEFEGSVGRVPKNLHMTIYGDSGHGKTEFAIRIAKQYCKKKMQVDWISYEQGHGFDLQQACIRNNMKQHAEYFQISDPHSKPDDVGYFEDFFNKVVKRDSPDVFVIDSSKYCEFTIKEFRLLFNHKKIAKKKTLLWISHKEGRLPEGTLAKDIAKLGGITFLVKNYIAEPVKNRFGGNAKYVIFEERARLLEQKFFLERDKAANNAPKPAENNDEDRGVFAHD